MQCPTAAKKSWTVLAPDATSSHRRFIIFSGEEGSPSGLALLPDPRARTGTPQLSAMALPFFRLVITSTMRDCVTDEMLETIQLSHALCVRASPSFVSSCTFHTLGGKRRGAPEVEATNHHDAPERPVDVVGVAVVQYAVDAILCQIPKKAHAISPQMHREKRQTIQNSAEVPHLLYVSVSKLATNVFKKHLSAICFLRIYSYKM
ncbi:hypothetical protein DPMN_123859 [Dreissena polymorpha]|uniref:Uncharacterized protein n=1 Tax=Dreissena polymorpha TaxID=45954 RepID=A0A9D4GUK3_DREPO|nr:hypothetical protein DPMN_123859 [Dreissena polymorpha]